MNILEQFKNHLLSKKNKPSKITVKNYVSDVRRFIRWVEENSKSSFNPKKIAIEEINVYKITLLKENASTNSIERYISSLKSFFYFLKLTKIIIINPFDQEIEPKGLNTDPQLLKEFKLYLLSNNLSRLTAKNYLMDIKQFLDWLEKVASGNSSSYRDRDVLNRIDQFVVNEYKNRLLLIGRLSPSSINRKLSSIRKYLSWLGKKSIKINQVANGNANETTGPRLKNSLNNFRELQSQNYKKINEDENKKNSLGYLKIIDYIVAMPITKMIAKIQYMLWSIHGGNIFKPIKHNLASPSTFLSIFRISKNIKKKNINNIPKSIFAPLSISLIGLPIHKKIFHHLRHTRPKWYKIYHSYPIASYLHAGVLIISTTVYGSALYGSFYPDLNKQKPVFASPSIPPAKTLNFQGRLTDEKNNPITSITPLRFALYNNQSATGSALLWQEAQNITPDNEGKFAAIIGERNELPSSIFSENPSLYLGMTVGRDSELKPRQQLATLALSNDSEKLQGLIPITKNGAGTNNVILALDSAGNLTIGGKASPVFQASGGKFTISGKTLLLNSTSGSDGNIELSPDGTGIIDLQKPLQNTTNNNNITSAQGAVEIDDLLAVLATSSGQSAFTINQNSTGPLISASASGIAKFTLENNGTGIFAGNLVINGDTITSANSTFNLLNNTINLNIAGSASSISIGASTGSTRINNTLIASGGITVSANRSLIVSGNVASNLIPFTNSTHDIGSAANHWRSAYIDNLFTSPSATVSGFWQKNSSGDIFASSSSGSPSFTITQNGTVGINGSLCVKNTTGLCSANTSGTIYATNTTVQNADIAENYISSEALVAGDIVIPEALDNNMAIMKTIIPYQSQTIGVVSTRPGITLNSDAIADEIHPYIVPVALSGRVPVKVTTENGNIHPGDQIASSSKPGVGMKASRQGVIIGKALEKFNNPDPAQTGKIMVFVNLSSYISTTTGQNEEYNSGDNKTTPLATIKTGFIQAQKTVSDSLQITTENITIGGLTFKEYINTLMEKTITQQIQEQLDDYTLSPIPYTLISPLASTSAILSPTPYPLYPNSSPSAAYISNITNINNTFNASNSALLNASSSADLNISASNSAQQGADFYAAEQIASASGSLSPSAYPLTPRSTSAPTLSPIPYPLYPTSTASAQTDNEDFIELINKGQKLSNDYTNLPAGEAGLSSLSGQLAYTPSPIYTIPYTLSPILSDLSITGNLNIGGSLILSNNTINTIGNDLALQDLRQGNLSIMGDLVAIDTNGNLKVSGNASFAKDVTIKGKLTAGIIAPIPNQDLIIQLNDSLSPIPYNLSPSQTNPDPNSIIRNSQFTIRNASGSSVLAVTQAGDLIASGSGRFASLATNGFKIIRGAQADTSLTQTIASSSAGTAVITAHETQRTISSPYINTESLIYLSAASDTQGLSPYIARQTPDSFTISIPYPISKDIKINWWIIN